jgi:hypothetical protein
MQQSRQIGAAGQLDRPALCWLRNQAVKLIPNRIRDRSLTVIINYDIANVLA